MNSVSIGSIQAEGRSPRYYVVQDGRIVARMPTWNAATAFASDLCAALGYVAYRGTR